MSEANEDLDSHVRTREFVTGLSVAGQGGTDSPNFRHYAPLEQFNPAAHAEAVRERLEQAAAERRAYERHEKVRMAFELVKQRDSHIRPLTLDGIVTDAKSVRALLSRSWMSRRANRFGSSGRNSSAETLRSCRDAL